MPCVGGPQRLEEGIRFPGAGVTGSYKFPDRGIGSQTQILWKSKNQ